MECPKCGAEIDKSAMVCPNCKKVLKIICPECKTVNTKNTCRKCGKILVTKCAKCGKINLAKNKQCAKCGFSTEISAILNESNAETFAVLRIDFPNSDVVKSKLGSNQLYQKFKTNLDNLINNYVTSLNVRRQIVNKETYIIRFNKDYTMSASANSAIQTTIELINIFTKMNVKLLEKKQVALRCNFTIMQRDADKNPYNIDTKFQANMIHQSSDKSKKALDAFQVITDESFYEYYHEQYKMESLDSALVDGEMIRFYELDLKEFVNPDNLMNDTVKYEDESDVPTFVKSALIDQDKLTKETLQEENKLDDDDIYDIDMINFDQINCAFMKTESINVLDYVVQVLQQNPMGILALKAQDIYQPYTLKLLSAVEEIGIYDNIIPITCDDEMQYTPYSFFRNLISSVFNYTISEKLIDTNDFSIFTKIGGEQLVKDLIKLNKRPMEDIDSTRDAYFEIFLAILQVIPNTLIYIENFDKIDPSSMFALEQLFEHLEELNVSYLISYDKTFSLHKNAHFLLSRPYYTEITLTATPDEVMINSDINFYQNILTDFYFQRIMKYACGSTLFLDIAIQYLLESGVYEYSNNSVVMTNPKTIIVPSGLEKLIQRRINILKNNKEAVDFLTILVMLGTRVDEKTILALNIPKWQEMAENLADMGYIYSYNDCIYFSNYNILKKCLLEIRKDEEIVELCQNLFANIFTEDIPNPIKAYFYELSNNGEKVICEWEKLANISLSMGDVSTYLNCSSKILDSLEKYSSNWSKEELETYKTSLFENISNNLIDYNPENTKNLAEKTLQNLQASQNYNSYIALCTRMIQGSITHGEYIYALNLTHNILSTMDKSSLDPASPDFNLSFLLMSVIYVKILFNIGAYNDCLDIGYNILNVIDSEKLNNIQYSIVSKEEFKYLITECIAYIAIVDVVTMNEDVKEFLDIANKLLDFLPPSYSIFIQLQNLLKGQPVTLDSTHSTTNESICAILYYIINAFKTFKNDPEKFAQEIYKAKLIANDSMSTQLETLTDLLIGYAYIKRGTYKKASSMLYKIIKSSKEKGMNAIVHTGWYIMSILNIAEGKFDIAYGVLNNSTIQMEKSGGISEYLTMLHKVNMYKVLMNLNSPDQAQICLNQASYIIQKYGINFTLNVDNK